MPPKKKRGTPRASRQLVERKSYGLRRFALAEGLPALSALRGELLDMTDVLLGRAESPIPARRMEALMEVADAYFARASEMTMLIQQAETDGRVPKNHPYYKFRTGELRTFMEMAKRAAELGSRRITVVQLRFEQERTGRELE